MTINLILIFNKSRGKIHLISSGMLWTFMTSQVIRNRFALYSQKLEVNLEKLLSVFMHHICATNSQRTAGLRQLLLLSNQTVYHCIKVTDLTEFCEVEQQLSLHFTFFSVCFWCFCVVLSKALLNQFLLNVLYEYICLASPWQLSGCGQVVWKVTLRLIQAGSNWVRDADFGAVNLEQNRKWI